MTSVILLHSKVCVARLSEMAQKLGRVTMFGPSTRRAFSFRALLVLDP